MRTALCQIEVSDDTHLNLQRVREALAASRGADLAIFPEATLTKFGGDVLAAAQPLDGPWLSAVADAARENGIAVVLGTFEPALDNRVYNTAVAIDESGRLVGTYRKIHLFDAFDDRESDRVTAGRAPTVVSVGGLRVGLITCYDLRFPELARALVDLGADLLAVIAAWAPGPLKEEHWMTLARARAIENTIWVAAVGVAPDRTPSAQKAGTGIGRSLLIDPMGTVRADLGPRPTVRLEDVDVPFTEGVRQLLPCLSHRRPDLFTPSTGEPLAAELVPVPTSGQ